MDTEIKKPSIRELVPNAGPVGTEVRIMGENLGEGREGNIVSFNSIPVNFQKADDAARARATEEKAAPKSAGKAPAEAKAAEDAKASAPAVKGAIQNELQQNWKEDCVVVTVPEDATSGDVVVVVNGIQSNGSHFNVTVGQPTPESGQPQ